MRFIWVCKRIRENYEMTNYYNDNDARPSAHTNFFIISVYINLSSYLNSNSIWQIKSFRMIRTCSVTQKLRISTLKIRNPERDQINAYLPPDTPATALWRSDHTPPQKPSLSDVKDKLQHPAARCPEPGTGRHPSSAFTPDPPCVLRENFQLRSPCV